MSSDYKFLHGDSSGPIKLETADITVTAGTINSTSTSLQLVGRGAPGYGLAFADNAVRLLNNNASYESARPASPLLGEIWYNHTNKQLMNFVGIGVSGADQYGWTGIPSPASAASGNAVDINALGGIAKSGGSMTGFLKMSYEAGIVATGSTQGGAYALTKQFNEVTYAATGADGVALPTASAGLEITIINACSFDVKVYPAGTNLIESNSAGVAVTLGAGARIKFVTLNSSKWYMLSAVYA